MIKLIILMVSLAHGQMPGTPSFGFFAKKNSSICSGLSQGGHCWYLGTVNNGSCDTVCSTHGGCDAEGTINYVGTGGTDANCQAVANGLGLTSFGGGNGALGLVGCGVLLSSVYRFTGATTTCAGKLGDPGSYLPRICACNN